MGFSLVCSKSAKAYGPVGNCVKRVHTGIPLSFVYSYFGDSSTGLLKSNLGIINGATTNPNSIRMQDTMFYGDWVPYVQTELPHTSSPWSNNFKFDYVLFIVGDEDRVVYSVLIHFPSHKRRVYLGILEVHTTGPWAGRTQLRGTLVIPCHICLLFVSRWCCLHYIPLIRNLSASLSARGRLWGRWWNRLSSYTTYTVYIQALFMP